MATAEEVASIVVDHEGAAFVRALTAASRAFADPAFEVRLALAIRARPDLVQRWTRFSEDQRWTPAATVTGTVTGWYDGGLQDVVQHHDEAAAIADFIRRTAAHLHHSRIGEP